MIALRTLDSSVLSLIILMVIYSYTYNRMEKANIHYKLYMALIKINMMMIVIDILGWAFNGSPGSVNMLLNIGFNLLLYVLVPVGPMFWVLYTFSQVAYNEDKYKRMKKHLFLTFIIHSALCVSSLFNGIFFTVDPQNMYSRGDYYWLHVLFCYSFLIYSLIYIAANRERLDKKYYYSMLVFALPISIGGMLQVLFYGVTFTWSGMMLSNLIIYLNIQDRGLNTDYLTGVYNRRHLERFINLKIHNATAEKSFAGIIIDIDEFKLINDSFGHSVGDEALKNAAKIITESLGNNDFVSRIGGDEFFVIVDTSCRHALTAVIEKIKRNVEGFNNLKAVPYKLYFSFGYNIYDNAAKISAEEFLKQVDALMYTNKRNNSDCWQLNMYMPKDIC